MPFTQKSTSKKAKLTDSGNHDSANWIQLTLTMKCFSKLQYHFHEYRNIYLYRNVFGIVCHFWETLTFFNHVLTMNGTNINFIMKVTRIWNQ